MIHSQDEVLKMMTPHMREIIENFKAFGAPPLESLTPSLARELPTMADAALGTHSKHFIKKMRGPVLEVGKVEHRVIPGGDGELLLRVYSPQGEGPFPVMVYYHGGGWVIANLDTYDSSCRQITDAADCIVVSVAYRQAPENRYPAPVEDAYNAYKWVLENASVLNADPTYILIGGESAGGNLAASVCLLARERGLPLPVHQVLIYPVVDFSFDTDSHRTFKEALPLNSAMMNWFKQHYLKEKADGEEPYASPLLADLGGLPSTTIITAEIDPLADDGKNYAAKLKTYGVDVQHHHFKGVTHEFFGMAALLPEAQEALALVVDRISTAKEISWEQAPGLLNDERQSITPV